jgi:predicted dehydrogenase
MRVAMIGAGAMAAEHIKAFADVPGVTVAGIWNRTSEKAAALAKRFAVPVVADGIAQLHAQTRADLVVVAVYETAINAVMKQAMEEPWTILMEKPVGLDLDDAQDIAAAAKVKGSRVFVGLNRRCLSSTVAALADVAADKAPRFIHVQDQQSLEVARALGHAEPVVRNWMYTNSVHLIDYLRTFGRGEVSEVTPIARWNPRSPGVVLAKVSFTSGDLGLYEGIWHGPGPWACTVSTPRRRWELRPLEKAAYQDAGERRLVPIDVDAWDEAFKPGIRRQAERVVESVRDGGDGAVTLADAVETMRLVRDVFRA